MAVAVAVAVAIEVGHSLTAGPLNTIREPPVSPALVKHDQGTDDETQRYDPEDPRGSWN